MCATVLVNWVDRVYGGDLRSNTAIYGQGQMRQASNRLHHHIDSADVFFSDVVAQTKRSRDIVVHREDKGALRSACGRTEKKAIQEFQGYFSP